MKRLVTFVVVVILLSACGSEVSENDVDAGARNGVDASSPPGADARDEARDAGPEASGPLVCGSTTCVATEYCIVPCSGGILPVCLAPEDGGDCPVGTQRGMCLGDGGPTMNGCVTSPPPPYCSPNPTCNGNQGRATGRRIDCVCA